MLKYFVSLLWIIVFSIWNFSLGQELDPFGPTKWLEGILTNNDKQIIDEMPDTHAMNEGAYHAVRWDNKDIPDLSDTQTKITDHEEATKKTVKYIQRLINWALWFVAVIAMLVVIIWWIQMITAAGDDAKYKTGKKAMKKAAIGIIWISLSWVIISFIFWLVDLLNVK